MHLEDYFEFEEPEIISIKGHRLGIEHVLEQYLAGYSAEQIAQEFPGLTLEQIHATIAYYLHNQANVNSYIEQSRPRAEHAYQEWAAHPSPLVERLQRLKQTRVEQTG
jgi:uncharacterized protein (DUF433 family)